METPGGDEASPTGATPDNAGLPDGPPSVTPPPAFPPDPPPAVAPPAATPPPMGTWVPVEEPSGTADSAGGLLGGDWPAQATDAIVNVVGSVRDRTIGPISTVARGLVFGLFAVVLGLMLVVLFLVGAIRLLDEALPSTVWLPYLILGVIFLVAGALVFRRRYVPSPDGNSEAH